MALLLPALGLMVTPSWGWARPDLVGGSLLLYLLWWVWRDADLGNLALGGPISHGVSGAALVLAALLTLEVVHVRETYPYQDAARSTETVSLGPLAGAFGSVHTNASTGRYLADVTRCLSAYPARWKAVLPDNAGLYAFLGLRNPMPMDWLLPAEYAGTRFELLPGIRRVAQERDYLLLFQTRPAPTLWQSGAKPPGAQAFTYDPAVSAAYMSLPGMRITCGEFSGIWQPVAFRSGSRRQRQVERRVRRPAPAAFGS